MLPIQQNYRGAMKSLEDTMKSELGKIADQFDTTSIRIELLPASKLQPMDKKDPWLLVAIPVLTKDSPVDNRTQQEKWHDDAKRMRQPRSPKGDVLNPNKL